MKWQQIDQVIASSLEQGFPGGQLIVEKGGERLYTQYFGSTSLTDCEAQADGSLVFTRGQPVTASTLFDIASLTKLFATTYLFQKYAQDDPALLDRKVSSFFKVPAFQKDQIAVGNISIKALLSHHAGFEPNPLFYDPSYSAELYCQDRAVFVDALLKAPLVHRPESFGLYSDVDFMLLTFILERIAGKSLEVQLRESFWEPLGLKHICYNPLQNGFSKDDIAGTERQGNTRDGLYDYPNIRKREIQGEVQDEKAFYCMEGISGHAGLFSNAEDLLTLWKLMTDPATLSNGIFSNQIKNRFLTPVYQDQTFGLGYRLNGFDMRYMFGDYAGKDGNHRAYGHTGWTGCLVTHDPLHELSIVYLTNRKNTPVCNPQQNPHLFYGDQLPAGKYLNIIHAIYHDLGITS